MPSSASVLWAVVACHSVFQLCLAAPAPFQSVSGGTTSIYTSESSNHPTEFILTMAQPTTPPRDLDSATGPMLAGELLPVSEIFKMMSEMSEASLSMTPSTPMVSSEPMSASTSTTSVDTQITGQPTRARPIYGPGLVVSPELAPPNTTSGQSVDHDHHPSPAPIRKLIVIGLVMGGIIFLALCVFLLYNRHGFMCRREKKTAQTDTKISPFYEAKKDDELDCSTDSLVNPVWPKFPPAATHQPRDKQTTLLTPSNPRVISEIMDITQGFPRSRFSITSSDYAHSLRSSTISSNVSMPPLPIVEQAPPAPPPLLPPSEFFSLPSSPDLRQSLSSGHSRNRSAPIFGHKLSSWGFLAGTTGRMRAGDHRKSKSISGLVYDVGKSESVSVSSHRRSASSKFSQYKGTPPTNGFLSADC